VESRPIGRRRPGAVSRECGAGAAFSADGHRVVTGKLEGTVQVWDTFDWPVREPPRDETFRISCPRRHRRWPPCADPLAWADDRNANCGT